MLCILRSALEACDRRDAMVCVRKVASDGSFGVMILSPDCLGAFGQRPHEPAGPGLGRETIEALLTCPAS